MPRKQRFKPSRKPQTQQPQPAKDNTEERQEIHPDDVDPNRESSKGSEGGGGDHTR